MMKIASKKRLSIFYIVDSVELNNVVSMSREIISETDMNDSLVGRATLYPLHVTIRGIFKLENVLNFNLLSADLEKTISTIHRFQATTNSIMNFPDNSISLSFIDQDVLNFTYIQKLILSHVLDYQAHNIEKEYRKFLVDSNAAYKKNTVIYGEPYVGSEYVPHITIASGLTPEYFPVAKKKIQGLFINPFVLDVNGLSLVYEERFGGNWVEVIKYSLG